MIDVAGVDVAAIFAVAPTLTSVTESVNATLGVLTVILAVNFLAAPFLGVTLTISKTDEEGEKV